MYIELNEKELYKTISEVDEDNTGKVSFQSFLEIYYNKKILPGLDDKKQDLIDAFGAVGGGPGEEGSVDAEVLIHIIKKEFQLSIDIEALIEEIDEDGSGEIEFDEFELLLKSDYTD